MEIFYEYYIEYANYLLLEKKWEYPIYYTLEYGNASDIYKKGYILMYPLEIGKEIWLTNYSDLKNLIINYYSFMLLADDIFDIESDLHQHYLTYPIAVYFKLTGKLPVSLADLHSFIPDILQELQCFKVNVNKIELNIGKHSLVLNETLHKIINLVNEKVEATYGTNDSNNKCNR